MKLQKLLSPVLAVALVVTLFAGCAQGDPFTAVYPADQADLSMAMDVIVEPKEPPFNLGGWLYGNVVCFHLNLPQEDQYTVTLEYSRPGKVPTAQGTVMLYQDNPDDCSVLTLDFAPTGEKNDDWSVYQTVSFAVQLPAGRSDLLIYQNDPTEGCDHFINLRSVTLTGTKPAPKNAQTEPAETALPSTQATQMPTETPDPTAAPADELAFSGWWILSPNYYEGVIPIVSIFYVDQEAGVWTLYDSLGNPGQELPCSFPEENLMVLDLDMLGSQELYLEDGILYYTDDGHEAYVKTDDPGFVQIGSFAGRWVLMGDPSRGVFYDLTDSSAAKTESGMTGEAVPYETSMITVSVGNGTLKEKVPYLDLEWPAPDLYPSDDAMTLVEEDTFRCNVYIREGAQVSAEYAETLDRLVNSEFLLYNDPSGDSYLKLTMNGDYVFTVTTFVRDGDWYMQDNDLPGAFGSWNLGPDLNLKLAYNDGRQETLNLTGWDGTLTVDGLVFTGEENPF